MEFTNRIIPYLSTFFRSIINGFSYSTIALPSMLWSNEYSLWSNEYNLWIFLFTLLFIILYMAYIKLRYPFWNLQPVQHSYFYQWSRTPGFIQWKPVKTKFYDSIQIETYPYSDLTDETKKEMVNFLHCHYLKSENMLFVVKKTDLDEMFNGHIHPSFVSLFYETHYRRKHGFTENVINDVVDNEETQIIRHKTPDSVILSRYAVFRFNHNGSNGSNGQMIPIYYWDFIGSKRDNPGHIHKLIQTHEYNCRKKNPDILVSLFKKESDLCDGIIPLVRFSTSVFYLDNIKLRQLPMGITIGNKKSVIHEFVENIERSEMFTIWSISENSMFSSRTGVNMPYTYYLQQKNTVLAAYFFQNTMTQHEYTDFPAIRLVASICNTKHVGIFVQGFYHAIREFMKTQNAAGLRVILVDDISHSAPIIENMTKHHELWSSFPTAFYLYNYSCPDIPIPGNKSFIVI